MHINQIEHYNHITWSAPRIGAPVSYNIYRDANLTQFVATALRYYDDRNTNPNVDYTYYIVAVDALGNVSAAAAITVTQNC